MKRLFLLIFLLISFQVYSQKYTATGTIVFEKGDSVSNTNFIYKIRTQKIKYRNAKGRNKRAGLAEVKSFTVNGELYSKFKIELFKILAKKETEGLVSLYSIDKFHIVKKDNYHPLLFWNGRFKKEIRLYCSNDSIIMGKLDSLSIGELKNIFTEYNQRNTAGKSFSLIDSLYYYKPVINLKFSYLLPAAGVEIKLSEVSSFNSIIGINAVTYDYDKDSSLTISYAVRSAFRFYYNNKRREEKKLWTYRFTGRYLSLGFDYFHDFKTAQNEKVFSINHGWQFTNFYRGYSEICFGVGADFDNKRLYFLGTYYQGIFLNKSKPKKLVRKQME